MSRKKIVLTEPARDPRVSIKVQLDQRTVITVGNLKALEFWKQRYPKAVVI